jgi:MoaA/NifB/PqqE/SkfB family radical SAM enzyme
MLLMPQNDPNRPRPLDYPLPDRPHRVYVALTNGCNRACPWCSTCSSPRGNTWLTIEQFHAGLPGDGPYEVQLEGGEPTVHPQFWEFVNAVRSHPRCQRLVLCTNGVLLPRSDEGLRNWVARLGVPLTLKLSLNHYLLDHDPGLISLATALQTLFAESAGERLFVLNVRLRRGYEQDDERVRRAVEQAGLLPAANIFYLQRYGFAAGEAQWESPAPVSDHFTMINPDGQVFGPDLVARSEAMGQLA